WQLEVRRNLFSALGMMDLMQDKANIQLNPKVIRSENRDGYQLREIEINSTPGRRIRLVLTVPNGKGPFPAVISIHGHGGKSLSVYDSEEHYHRFAHELAKRSYVTIAPFVSQHG